MNTFPRTLLGLGALAASCLFVSTSHAQNFTTSVSTGGTLAQSTAEGANPATDKIYVANYGLNTVTVINGADNTTATVNVGTGPRSVAVNPVTNKIYVACNDDASSTGFVTVIDGATNTTSTIPGITGEPEVVAVNPVTNQIYVGTEGVGGVFAGSSVLVIDGASATVVATVTNVNAPGAFAVNPVTNKIYVANLGTLPGNSSNGAVTVIDGATNLTTTIVFPTTSLSAIAVNPVTNQIYTAGQGAGDFFGNITQIDGASATVVHQQAIGAGPYSLAVNPVANTVYVADEGGEIFSATPSNLQTYTVWALSGANVASGPQQLQVGSTDINGISTNTIQPLSLALNPTTNQIYVGTNNTTGIMTVINGQTNTYFPLGVGGASSQTAVVVNPVTNRVYFCNYGGSVSVLDGTVPIVAATVPTGDFPLAMVLNPVTNKIYVVNFIANIGVPGSVTVIDARTHTVSSTVTVGIGAWAIDVNPVTNKIYVANSGSVPSAGTVSVIDGSTDTVTATITVGVDPNAVVVNPDTNKIFVTNYGYIGGGSVSVIDGATNTVSATLPTRPYAIAVDTKTNRAYFSNYHSVTVADGTTGATIATIATISAGNIAVNAVSNKIYVLNNQDNNGDLNTVTIIDGSSNTVLAAPGTQFDPAAIAINPVTNMVYIVDQGNGSNGYVTIINGSTNAYVGFVPTPIFPASIAVNPITNKIYVNNFGSGGLGTSTTASGNTVTVIDGYHTGTTANLTTGYGPTAVLVNPATDEVFVLSQGSSLTSGGSVTVIGDHQVVPLTTSFTPLVNGQTASPTPSFTFTPQSLFSPTAPTPLHVYFQIDSLTGVWSEATGTGPSFSGTAAALAPGLHTLYAYADDGQDAAATELNSPLIGAVDVYEFVVTSPATQLVVSAPGAVDAGTPFNVVVSALDAFGNPPIGYAGTIAITSSDSGAVLPAANTLSAVGGIFPVTLYGTPETSSSLATVTATDTVTPALTALANITVVHPTALVNLQLPLNLVYDGTGKSATATTTPFGLSVVITYADLSTGAPATTVPPITPGFYEVVATIDDPVHFGSATNFFTLQQAQPPLSWVPPAAIANGTALTGTQLDATSTLPGIYSYNPVAGAVLPYGVQTLTVTFTPNDSTDYASASISTSLTVNPPPSTAPVVTTSPAGQVAAPGGTATFSVAATGFPAPTYQWYYNNVLITGATNSTLTFPVDSGLAGTYSVTVMNTQGSITRTAGLAILTGQLSGDPSLSQPGYLTSDGPDLLVEGKNLNPSDPNSNPASQESIFSVALPLGSAAATSLYPAFNPDELAAAAGTVYWIDPNSGPLGTQILSASEAGGTPVNPIYTSSSVNAPIVAGSGLATDGTLLYAADQVNGSVWSVNVDGSGLTQIGPNRYGGGLPAARLNTIAVLAGTLYLADSGSSGGTPAVLSIGTTGATITTLASGAPLVSPSGIAVGNGVLYVADPAAGNTVWQIPLAGGAPAAVFTGSVGTPIGHLAGLAYTNGKLYVADSGAGAIYELQVDPQPSPAITSALTAAATVQANFSYQVQVGGGIGPYTYGATGLPAGLSINSAGLISGTPTLAGIFPVTLTVTDSTAPTPLIAPASLQLTVGALTVTSSLTATAFVGNFFDYQVSFGGGSGTYTYAATGLPAGLALDPVFGSITGTPTDNGTFAVTLTVTDTSVPANTGQATLLLSIGEIEFIGFYSATAIANQPFAFPILEYYGTPPFTYSAIGLPAGLSINANSGLITGTVTAAGYANVTVTVTDSSDPAVAGQEQLVLYIDSFGMQSPIYVTGTVGTAFSFLPPTAGGTPPYTYTSPSLPAGLALNPNTGAITGTPTTSGTSYISVGVSDSLANSNNSYVVLTVAPQTPAPTLTGPVAASGQVGTFFSYTPTSTNAMSFGATNLPPGVTLNTTSGVFSGTPTQAGVYVVSLTATNSTASTEESITVTLAAAPSAPAYTGSDTPSGTEGTALNFTPTYTNAATSFALTAGTLPTGLGFNTGTGAITGTPTQVGVFPLSLQATGPGGSVTTTLSLTINSAPGAPVISSLSTATATVGASFTFTVTSSPAPLSFLATGLPPGLTLAPGSSGLISGIPTSAGTYPVQLSATNAIGTGPTATLALTVNPSASAPVMTSAAVVPATAGTTLTYNLTASNAPSSFAVTSGTLPAGLTFGGTSIGGIPTQVGQTTIWLAATNTAGQGPALGVLFNVAPAANTPVITSNGTANAQVGQNFSYSITATHSPTGFAAAGLPASLTVNLTTGVISGVPASATTTAASVSLTASNASGASNPKILLLTVASAPATSVITSASTGSGQVGTAFTYLTTATASPTSFAADNLPAGLALNTTSGAITGMPTVAGTFAVTLQAGNAAGSGPTSTLTLTIAAAPLAPAITSPATAIGQVGVAFSYTIAAAGTITDYAATGTLPLGLALNTSTGVISGVPADPGTTLISLTATNAAGTSLPQNLSITINPAANVPVITSPDVAEGQVGQSAALDFPYTITATNMPGTPPFPPAATLEAVNLPPGLAVNPATGVISGTPTEEGTFVAGLVGTNASGSSAVFNLTIYILPAATAPAITSALAFDAQVGVFFSTTVTASNTPFAYEVLGAPAWMTVASSTGVISGTPTSPGTVTMQLVASNGAGDSPPATLTLQVAAAANTPVISSSQTSAGTVGTNFTYQVTVGAGPPAPSSYLATGLPSGLTLNPVTGAITGNPTASGTFAVSVAAFNANGEGQPVTVTFTIAPDLSLNF